MAGIDMLHVPYKGSTAAHADLLNGRTTLMLDTVTAINPHVKSGALRALAGTPVDVVAKLAAEITKALGATDVRQKLLEAGIEPGGGTPAQFRGFIQSEITKWAQVAKTAGIKPE
jgi:tripartite-type tricarboxylate transporter receptor subunit TctC